MIEATNILFVYIETPLHAGSGRGIGTVDLPIQRERASDYPIVQGSGLKGRLRADAEGKVKEGKLTKQEWLAIFGPEREGSKHAGALSLGDARTLLFPVRSLKGVFAWTTSAHALARFCRDAQLLGGVAPNWTVSQLENGQALVAPNSPLIIQDDQAKRVVLEEFSFAIAENALVADTIAVWLKGHALPGDPEYKYWQDNLAGHLVILSDDDFRDFTQFNTEVVTRVRINNNTKTVESGALWTEESLPADTLLYAPVHAMTPRAVDKAGMTSGADVLAKLRSLDLKRTRLGGDETVGRGSVCLRFWEGGNGHTTV